MLSICPAFLIHFLYNETVTESESRSKEESLWVVVRHYRHFFQIRYKMARQVVVLLLYMHGMTYFLCSYGVERIKAGYSKELGSSIENLSILPMLVVNSVLSKLLTADNAYRYQRGIFAARLIAAVAIFCFRSEDPLVVSCNILLLLILGGMGFIADMTIVNGFGSSAYSGLCVTMMASMSNLGKNSSLQLEVISWVGL